MVSSGGVDGVALANVDNVSVDASGYLHLKITNAGGNWTAAQLFTTDDLGFGTYQWQIDAPLDRFDPNVVLGLFPYGPEGGVGSAGTNEIEIDYSRFANACGPNADWTTYPASGTTIGESRSTFSLKGSTLSTTRLVWSKSRITIALMSGIEPVGATSKVLKSWAYAPPDPAANIPQQAIPVGMNLWCFNAPPSDGQNVDVVIRDFEFVPEASRAPSDGGADAASDAAAGDAASSGATASGEDAASGTGGTEPGCVATNETGGAGGRSSGGNTASGGATIASHTSDAGVPSQSHSSSSGCGCQIAQNEPEFSRWATALVALFVAGIRRRRVRRNTTWARRAGVDDLGALRLSRKRGNLC
jgi:hypothetical protein